MWLWWIIFCWRKVGLLVLCLATDKNAGLVALATLRYCCLLMGWNGIFFFKILYFILPLCFVYSPLRLKWPVIWEQNHLTDEKLYHFELWQKDEDPAVVPVHYECIVHCVLLLYDIRMQLSQNIPIGLMSFKLRQTSVYMVHTDKACIFLINVFSWCLFDGLHQSEIKKKKIITSYSENIQNYTDLYWTYCSQSNANSCCSWTNYWQHDQCWGNTFKLSNQITFFR